MLFCTYVVVYLSCFICYSIYCYISCTFVAKLLSLAKSYKLQQTSILTMMTTNISEIKLMFMENDEVSW